MVKAKRGTSNRFAKAKTFYDQLKLALEFCNNPDILDSYSPLATPYFLRQDSYPSPNRPFTDSPPTEDNERGAIGWDAIDWGSVLVDRLGVAMATLWSGDLPTTNDELLSGLERDASEDAASCYHFYVLELNYFKRIYRPAPSSQAEIYNDILHVGRTTHDRHLKEAVEHLGSILLQQLRPAIRLEMPSHAGAFLGRDNLHSNIQKRLRKSECISLIGPSGIGKTTLATMVLESWQPEPTFWFTVRHNFNDRLPSLLFALGYFLHKHGSSGLWLQLVANGGTIDDANLALALALADLEQLHHLPLLCIDEIDLLHPSDIDSMPIHHGQLLTFIESLKGHAPMLLVGQQSIIESNFTFMVERLQRADIQSWLTTNAVPHDETELSELERYTKGNPRLLTLAFTLYQSLLMEMDATLADALARLPSTPGLTPIWTRIRRRLSKNEQTLLSTLSVFRTAAPEDIWKSFDGRIDAAGDDKDTAGDAKNDAEESVDAATAAVPSITETPVLAALNGLLHRHLLQRDGVGSLALLPVLSEVVYSEMAVEQREMAHLQAAHICTTRGEVTEAAYHFHKAGHPEEAIQQWYPRMQDEIQRGQIAAALPVFEEISSQRLKPQQQKELALIRAELYQLRGEPERVVDSLERVEWTEDEPLSVEAMALWGKALDDQGDSPRAEQKLAHGIEVAAHLLQELSRLHVARGRIHMRERDMSKASQEVLWAHFHAEMLEGAIQAEQGQPAQAQSNLERAVEIAEKLADLSALGRAHYYLANSARLQQNFEKAFEHYEKSISYYQTSGNQLEEAQLRANLASAYLPAGDYHAAIREATEALTFFKRMKSPYWSALNENTIAESYVELGDLENAETHAMEVIGYEDTEFFPYGLFTLGSIRLAKDMLNDAQQLYDQCSQIASENEDIYLLAYAKRSLGETEYRLDNVAEAQAALKQALSLFQQMGIGPEIEKTESIIATIS